jgi:hypothetical protein
VTKRRPFRHRCSATSLPRSIMQTTKRTLKSRLGAACIHAASPQSMRSLQAAAPPYTLTLARTALTFD